MSTRDMRSESMPYKRDHNQKYKWEYGTRPLPGIRLMYNPETLQEELTGGTEASRDQARPNGPCVQHYKTHANKTAKPHGVTTERHGRSSGRLSSKNEAAVDANEGSTSQLSNSLLELSARHIDTLSPATQAALPQSALDNGVLYSFDNKGPSPGDKGRRVDLGGLVELAEQKWDSKQTEKIVKGEYEVLDIEGETTVISKKKKGSPKQKASKSLATAPKLLIADEDGYELI